MKKKSFSYGYANFIQSIRTAATSQAPDALASKVITSEDNSYAFRLTDFKFAGASAKTKLAAVKISGLTDPAQGVIKFYQSKTKSWVDLTAGQTLDVNAADIVKGYLLYAPPKDQFGAALTNFQYAVSTNGKSFSTKLATMSIDVTPVDDAPIAKNSTFDVGVGVKQALSISDFLFQDVDNASYSGVQFTKLPTQGVLQIFNSVTNTWESVKLNQIISADDIQAKKLAFVTPGDAPIGNYTTLAFKIIDPAGLSSNEAIMQLTTHQTKALISGEGFAVLTEDTNVTNEGLLVAQGSLKVENSYQLADFNFLAQHDVLTQYGRYSIDIDGKWVYSINNTLQAVQQLGVNDSLIDSFEVTSQDGTATELVMITVSGMNDQAAIDKPAPASVTEDVQRFAYGKLTIHDTDLRDGFFQTQTGTTSRYGTFSIDANGNWKFVLDGGIKNTNVQSLAIGESVIDSFTVRSIDNSADSNVYITINGTNDKPQMTGGTVLAATNAMQPYVNGFRIGDYFHATDIDHNATLAFNIIFYDINLDVPAIVGNPLGSDFYHAEYSLDNGVQWIHVNDFENLYADENTLVRLMPNNTEQFDQGFIYDAYLPLSVQAWDKTSNDSNSLSSNSKYLFLAQSGFNDTPSIKNTGNQSLAPILASTPGDKNLGVSILSITKNLILNDKDLSSVDLSPTWISLSSLNLTAGSIPQGIGGFRGLAITGLQCEYGKWQFSLDGGLTWQDIRSDVSDTNALLLRDQDKIRYQSLPINVNGSIHNYAEDAALSVKAWDRSLFDFTGTTLGPFYMDTTPEGYSVCSEDSYSTYLNPEQMTNPVFSVTELLSENGSGSQGLAIFGLPSLEQGSWQYSLDGGASWGEVNTANLSINNALLLQQGDLLRMNGSASSGDESVIGFREWYMNVAKHGDYLNAAVTGSPSPFSPETVTCDLQVKGESPPTAEAAASLLSLTDILDACPHVINPDGEYSTIDLGSGSTPDNAAFPVAMTVSDVLHLSPDHSIHQLLIDGDANDQVAFNTNDGGHWTAPDSQTINLENKTYVKYVGTYQGETVEVLINAALSTSLSSG